MRAPGKGPIGGRLILRQKGKIVTIGQAASHYLTAICGNCEHWNDVSLDRLRETHGDHYPLTEVFRRLRCRHCRRQAYALVIDSSRRMKRSREPPAGNLAKFWWEERF